MACHFRKLHFNGILAPKISDNITSFSFLDSEGLINLKFRHVRLFVTKITNNLSR